MSSYSKVIEFWISQKNNWFIPESEKRSEFDELIKNKYGEIYKIVSDYLNN